MLARRLRRQPNIKTTLCERLVSAGRTGTNHTYNAGQVSTQCFICQNTQLCQVRAANRKLNKVLLVHDVDLCDTRIM